MMFSRSKIDILNSTTRTVALVEDRYPEETVLFSSAVTILETTGKAPVGWSLRRLFQRRGNVVITTKRVVIRTNFVSLISLFWLGFMVYCIIQYMSSQRDHYLLGVAVPILLLFQRRPFEANLQFDEIESVGFGGVQGVTLPCDIVSFGLTQGAIQIVASRVVDEDVRQVLTSAIGSETAEDARAAN